MLGERGCLDRRVWRLAKHIPGFSYPAEAGRETHPAATGTSALPKHQDMREISENIMKINDLRDLNFVAPRRAARSFKKVFGLPRFDRPDTVRPGKTEINRGRVAANP
jgi:hypothetical protein